MERRDNENIIVTNVQSLDWFPVTLHGKQSQKHKKYLTHILLKWQMGFILYEKWNLLIKKRTIYVILNYFFISTDWIEIVLFSVWAILVHLLFTSSFLTESDRSICQQIFLSFLWPWEDDLGTHLNKFYTFMLVRTKLRCI